MIAILCAPCAFFLVMFFVNVAKLIWLILLDLIEAGLWTFIWTVTLWAVGIVASIATISITWEYFVDKRNKRIYAEKQKQRRLKRQRAKAAKQKREQGEGVAGSEMK